MQKKVEIQLHFEKNDPIIARYLSEMSWNVLAPKETPDGYFDRLCRDIIAQQLSGKAADAILTRFQALLSSESPSAEQVLSLDGEVLRSVGLSWAKVRYIKDLAERTVAQEIPYYSFSELTEEEIVSALTQVKGIGRWTAEMFLLFTLGKEDIFSHGDLGLKNGLKLLYGNGAAMPATKIEEITSKWSPYKSYGSLALWHSLNNR